MKDSQLLLVCDFPIGHFESRAALDYGYINDVRAEAKEYGHSPKGPEFICAKPIENMSLTIDEAQ
jgi:hypothetical protein